MFKSFHTLRPCSFNPGALVFLFICIVIFINGCSTPSVEHPKKELQLDFLTFVSQEERLSLEYLLKQQSSSDYAIFTNYKETVGQEHLSTGHEQLSESVGLMMEYALARRSEVLFDTQFQILKKDFLTNENLAKWRIHALKKRTSGSSALVDDLRIMKALYQAGSLWSKPAYTHLATQMSNSILLFEAQGNTLVELYDGFEKGLSKKIPLFYLDLSAMQTATTNDVRWRSILDNSHTILTQGVISEKLPLYHHSYDYETRQYQSGKTVNMIEALLPLLSLYELGETNPTALKWLNHEISTKKAIYGSYSTADATPATKVQSAAVYALAARIAHLAGDDALSTKCLTQLSELQIKHSKTKLNGAFGDEPSQMVYSYDNLQALLAYSQP